MEISYQNDTPTLYKRGLSDQLDDGDINGNKRQKYKAIKENLTFNNAITKHRCYCFDSRCLEIAKQYNESGFVSLASFKKITNEKYIKISERFLRVKSSNIPYTLLTNSKVIYVRKFHFSLETMDRNGNNFGAPPSSVAFIVTNHEADRNLLKITEGENKGLLYNVPYKTLLQIKSELMSLCPVEEQKGRNGNQSRDSKIALSTPSPISLRRIGYVTDKQLSELQKKFDDLKLQFENIKEERKVLKNELIEHKDIFGIGFGRNFLSNEFWRKRTGLEFGKTRAKNVRRYIPGALCRNGDVSLLKILVSLISECYKDDNSDAYKIVASFVGMSEKEYFDFVKKIKVPESVSHEVFILLCITFSYRGFSEVDLQEIFGIGLNIIQNIKKVWMPRVAIIMHFLCDLYLTAEEINFLEDIDGIENITGKKLTFYFDGTDIATDYSTKNSYISKQKVSQKLGSLPGYRGINLCTASGLICKFTPLFGARTDESTAAQRFSFLFDVNKEAILVGDRAYFGINVKNHNRVLTPSFLQPSIRSRFSVGEIVSSKNIAQMRWVAEAVEARIKEFQFLRYGIPHRNEKYAECFWIISSGIANFRLPFRHKALEKKTQDIPLIGSLLLIRYGDDEL